MVKNIIKKSLTTASLLLLSLTVESATYDLLEEQKTDQLLLPNTQLGNSFFTLDPTPQQAINDQKRDYLEALELIKNKKLKEAEKKINTLLKNNPKEPEFYNLQGLLDTINKQPELAIKNHQKAIALDQKNLKAHLSIAKISLDTGNLKRAKEYAYKTLSINNKTPYTFYILADIALKQNQPLEAEKTLLTAKQRNQGNIKIEVAIANKLGKLYILQKQPEKILSLAKDIINFSPKDSSAMSLLANAQLINHQKKEAEKTLKKLINQDKQDIQHRLLLVRLLINQQEKKESILTLLNEISSIAPNNPQVLTQKSAFLIKLKRYQEALEIVEKVKKLAPKSGAGQLIEGNVYLATKDLIKALPIFQKSYEIKPDSKVLFTIVDIMTATEKQTDAVALLNKELKKDNNNLTAHLKLAVLYQQLNILSKAEFHYKTILTIEPNNALILNNLALIYHQQDNPKSLELAKQAYKINPNSAAITDTYGVILTKHGNLKHGLDMLEKSRELAPNIYDTQYHLANAYALNNNPKEAIAILNHILNTKYSFKEKSNAIALSQKLGKN